MSTEKFTYTEEVTGEIVNIPVKLLHHHHANPRGQNYGDLSELTASIKANGIPPEPDGCTVLVRHYRCWLRRS